MPDKRYKAPNGRIVTEKELSDKYGDRLEIVLSSNNFTEINEPIYKAPNGKLATESDLKKHYGNQFDSVIKEHGFSVDFTPKKKEDSASDSASSSPSTSQDEELVLEPASGSLGGQEPKNGYEAASPVDTTRTSFSAPVSTTKGRGKEIPSWEGLSLPKESSFGTISKKDAEAVKEMLAIRPIPAVESSPVTQEILSSKSENVQNAYRDIRNSSLTPKEQERVINNFMTDEEKFSAYEDASLEKQSRVLDKHNLNKAERKELQKLLSIDREQLELNQKLAKRDIERLEQSITRKAENIKSLDKKIESFEGKENLTDEDIQEANQLIATRNSLVEASNEEYDAFTDKLYEVADSVAGIGTVEQEIETAKRNYGFWANTSARAVLGFRDLGSGIVSGLVDVRRKNKNLITDAKHRALSALIEKDFDSSGQISEHTKQYAKKKYDLAESFFLGMTSDNYTDILANFVSTEKQAHDNEYLDFVERSQSVDAFIREHIRPNIEVDKIKSFGDALTFTIDGLTENTATLMLLSNGVAGELLFTGSHAANLVGQFEVDRKDGYNIYSDSQMRWAAAGMALSETAFHKYIGIGRQLKLFKRTMKSAGSQELKRQVAPTVRKTLMDVGKGSGELGKSVGMGIAEGFSIALTHNTIRATILDEENVNFAEGMLDQAGGYISLNAVMTSTRLIGGRALGMFSDRGRRSRVAQNTRKIIDLEQELKDGDFSAEVRSAIEFEIQELHKDNAENIKQVVDGFDGLSVEGQRRALDISSQVRSLEIALDQLPKDTDSKAKELMSNRLNDLEMEREQMLSQSKETMDRYESLPAEKRQKYEDLAVKKMQESAERLGIKNYTFNEFQIRQNALAIFASGEVIESKPSSTETAEASKPEGAPAEVKPAETNTDVDGSIDSTVEHYDKTKNRFSDFESREETIGRLNDNLEGLEGQDRIDEANRIADIHAESYREFLTLEGEQFTEADIQEYRDGVVEDLVGRTEAKSEKEVKTETSPETTKTAGETTQESETVESDIADFVDVAPEEVTDFDNVLETERKKLSELEAKHGEKHHKTQEQRAVVNALEKNTAISVVFKNGETVVKGRGSNNQRTRRDAIVDAVEKGIYEGLPNTDLEGVPYDRASEHIAENSTNPVEVAETIEYERNARNDTNRTMEGSIEQAIATAIGSGVSIEHYNRHQGLKGKDRQRGLTQSYLRKDGAGLDMIAMEAEYEVFGDYNADKPRITEDMVVDFMEKYPSLSDFNANHKTATEIALEAKFTELTGLHPGKANLDLVKKGKGKSTSKPSETIESQYETEVNLPESNNYDDVPFQKGKNFKSIPKKAFDALLDRLIKAFPKMKGKIIADGKAMRERLNELREKGYDVRMQVSSWHGSPHIIKDGFKTDKIGTGEGNQAFGWGLYFTDLESIARDYADKLTEHSVYINGKEVDTLKGTPLYDASLFVFGSNSIAEEQGKESAIANLKQAIKDNRIDYNDAQKAIKYLEGLDSFSVKKDKRNLYKVSLHKGKQPSEYTWLEWDKPLNKQRANELIDKLTDRQREQAFEYGLSGVHTEGEFYKKLANALGGNLRGGDKNASLFLLENGIDGVKYPAESISRGATSDNTRGFNYVVFDESAITIEDHIQFLRTAEGDVYGFLDPENGKIYMDDAKMNANTPIHEFGHLWTGVLKSQFPMAHKKLLDAVKRDKKAMDAVRNDPAYKHLKTDEQIADEALARYIGDKGEQKFLQEEGLTDREKTIRQRIFDEIQRIWEGIKKYFDKNNKDIRKWTNEQWDNATMSDLTEAITGELLGGKDIEKKGVESKIREQQKELGVSFHLLDKSDFNADGTVKQSVLEAIAKEEAAIVSRAKADGTYHKAPNGKQSNLTEKQWVQVRTERFKEWFGDWERLAELKNIKTKEEALQWVKGNEKELIDGYLAREKNTIDPDKVRQMFSPIGYDGKNVPEYRVAEKYLVDKIYDSLLDKAEKEGDKTITFLTGVGGAGKSNATKKFDFSNKGVIFDSAFNSFSSLEKQLKKAHERGFDIEVFAVHNDAITAFTNTINRGKATGRFLSLSYFIDAFSSNKGKINSLTQKYPNVKIKALDNSGNNTKEVSIEDAKTWDYELSNEQIEQLLNITENESRRLNENQLAAVASGLQQITGSEDKRTSRMERLSNGINKRLEGLRQEESRDVLGGKERERVRLENETSKVTDANGEPMVVYHGGTVGNVFDAAYSGSGSGRESGFFFTPDIRQARDYAGGDNVKEVFLNIKNPLFTGYQLEPNEVAKAKSEGQDGYWLIEDGLIEESEIVSFSPNQIKSATDNIGTFSDSMGDIRFQKESKSLADELLEEGSRRAKLRRTLERKQPIFTKREILDNKNSLLAREAFEQYTGLLLPASMNYNELTVLLDEIHNGELLDYLNYDLIQSDYGVTESDIRRLIDRYDRALNRLDNIIMDSKKESSKDLSKAEKTPIFNKLSKENQQHVDVSYGSAEAFENNVNTVVNEARESQLKIDFDSDGKGNSKPQWEKQYKLDFGNPVRHGDSGRGDAGRNEGVLPNRRSEADGGKSKPDNRTVQTVHGELRKRTVLEGFQESGYVDIVGLKVESPQDIADLFLIHRSPLIEKGHIVYLKDGKILKTSAETLGLTAAASIDRKGISANTATELGADKIVFLHNHPSGNHKPSQQDIDLTKHYSKLFGNSIDFEHIVINTKKFTLINRDGTFEHLDYKSAPKPLFSKRISLAEGGDPQQVMMDVATTLSKGGAPNAVVYLNHNLTVAGYDIIDGSENLTEYVSTNAKSQGATRFAIISDGKNTAVEEFASSKVKGLLVHLKITENSQTETIKNQGYVEGSEGKFVQLWENKTEYGTEAQTEQTRAEKFLDLLDSWESEIDKFGRETLGINIPAVVAKGMINMMRITVKGGLSVAQAFNAGMDYIRETDWYKKLNEVDKAKVESKTFRTVITNAVRQAIDSDKKLNKIREKLNELTKSQTEKPKTKIERKDRIENEKRIRKEVVDDLVQFLSKNKIEGRITATEVNRLIKYAARIATDSNAHKAFDRFMDVFSKTEMTAIKRENSRNTEEVQRIDVTSRVDQMLASGMSESDIIDSFETKWQRDVAFDHIERQKNITDEEASKEWERISEDYNEQFRSKKPLKQRTKKWVNAVRKALFSSQIHAEDLTEESGLRRTRNLLRNFHGAKGLAKTVFDDAYTKIWGVKGGKDGHWALKPKLRDALNDMIFHRRVIEIEDDYIAKGKEPIMHSGGWNKRKAEAKLREMKRELGEKTFNDLMKRSDVYFDVFKKLLKDKYDAGMISKESYESIKDLNYSPRMLASLLLDFDGDLTERGKQNRKNQRGKTDAEIRSMGEGSLDHFFKESEWLLATALNSGYRNIAQNRLNNMLFREMEVQRERFERIEGKIQNGENLRRSEREFYDAYKELSEKIIDNPIVGFNKDGTPKYRYKKPPSHHFVESYRWVDGVRHSFFVESKLAEEWFANREGFLHPKAKWWISTLSGSRLVKYFATGNNPAFFISNTPRDMLYNYVFSDEFSPISVVGGAQMLKESFNASVDIVKHDFNLGENLLETLYDYGLSMEFLSTQGRIESNKILDLFPKNQKDNFQFVWRNLTLQQMQTANELMFRVGLAQRTIANFLKSNGIKDVNQITESLATEKGYENKQDMIDDMYQSAVSEARGILDFSRGGWLSKDLEAFIPYTNVSLQSTGKLLERLKKDPKGTTVKIAQVMGIMSTLPMMASILNIALRYNPDEDEEEDGKWKSAFKIYFETMDGLSKYERTNYAHIPLGMKDENGNWMAIRIAKEHALTAPFAVSDYYTQNFIRKLAGIKEESSASLQGRLGFALRKNYAASITPQDFITDIPIARTLEVQRTGYDSFRDQFLPGTKGSVKYGIHSLQGEGLTNPSVEEFWKAMGEQFYLSPIRTKYAVESIITSPSTNPMVGLVYGGADVIWSQDKTMKEVRDQLLDNISKSPFKRVITSSSDYNRGYAEREAREEEDDKFRFKLQKRNAKENELIKKVLDKEIRTADFIDEAMKIRPEDPKKVIDKLKKRIRNKDTSWELLNLRSYSLEERARAIWMDYGDILDPSNRETLKEMKKAGGILSEDFWKYYNKEKKERLGV